MAQKIEIPYVPEKIWRDIIHPNLENHRFSVIVAHRRFGKTVGTINHLIKMAVICKKPTPQLAYIAPYRKQAKIIAWNYLKYYTSVIPGIKINETELFIEFPTVYEGRIGARIYIVGADKPDTLRGTYWDHCVIDEYAQIKQELWNEIIRPAISDRKGSVIFIGTPKGQNQFYEIYLTAKRREEWYCCCYRADESGVFDNGGRNGPEELKLMKEDMTPTAIRQELYCDFTASAYNILIPIDLVTAATERCYTISDIAGAPKIIGIDVARFGDDSCCIFKRQGLLAYEPKIIQQVDNMTFASLIMQEIQTWKPDAVFIDAGRGEGVIDRCRQLGANVIEVNFASVALNKNRYANKRAEMWDSMRIWLEQGGQIPNRAELKSELSIVEYGFDGQDRIILEKKEKIKERIGKSPDIADGLALTFAAPVIPKADIKYSQTCNTEYEPI